MIFQKPCLVSLFPIILTNNGFSSSVFNKYGLELSKYSTNASFDILPKGTTLLLYPSLHTTYESTKLTSFKSKFIISETFIPVAYANSNIALSLMPFKSFDLG